MSWPSWLVVLFQVFSLFRELFRLRLGSLLETAESSLAYRVTTTSGTDVSVSEESSASPDQAMIQNERTVSGTGDINAVQTY